MQSDDKNGQTDVVLPPKEDDWRRERRVTSAIYKALRENGYEHSSDFSDPLYRYVWEYLHTYRGAGKKNAYGEVMERIVNDENALLMRGFVVGWRAAMAYQSSEDGDI